MYGIKKTVWVSAAHSLKDHEKCGVLHGHNYKIVVHCKSDKLIHGMVWDFGHIAREIKRMDHKNLNEHLNGETTAECIAKYVWGLIPHCYEVEVWETKDSMAYYRGER